MRVPTSDVVFWIETRKLTARQEYCAVSLKLRELRTSMLITEFISAMKLTSTDGMEMSTGIPSFNQVMVGVGMAKASQERDTFSPTMRGLLFSG